MESSTYKKAFTYTPATLFKTSELKSLTFTLVIDNTPTVTMYFAVANNTDPNTIISAIYDNTTNLDSVVLIPENVQPDEITIHVTMPMGEHHNQMVGLLITDSNGNLICTYGLERDDINGTIDPTLFTITGGPTYDPGTMYKVVDANEYIKYNYTRDTGLGYDSVDITIPAIRNNTQVYAFIAQGGEIGLSGIGGSFTVY